MPVHHDLPWACDGGLRHARRSRGIPRRITAVRIAMLLGAPAGLLGTGALAGPALAGSPSAGGGSYVVVRGPWRWRWVRVINPAPGEARYVHQRYRTVTYVGSGLPHANNSLPSVLVAVPGPWHSRSVLLLHGSGGKRRYVRERYRTISYVPAPAPRG